MKEEKAAARRRADLKNLAPNADATPAGVMRIVLLESRKVEWRGTHLTARGKLARLDPIREILTRYVAISSVLDRHELRQSRINLLHRRAESHSRLSVKSALRITSRC